MKPYTRKERNQNLSKNETHTPKKIKWKLIIKNETRTLERKNQTHKNPSSQLPYNEHMCTCTCT
jgi:hypothetical protein